MKKIVIYILTLVTVNKIAQSQNSVLTTAVPYLRIAADTRSAGMGDAGIGGAPDAAAIFWNGAKSLFADKKMGAQLSYTSWFREVGAKDIYLLSASGYAKLNDYASLTVGLRYYSQGTINITNINGEQLGSFRPRDWDMSVGYNVKLSKKMGVGVALRFINSALGGASLYSGTLSSTSSSLAGDISFYYKESKKNGAGLSWGLSLSNLGGKMGYAGSASTDKDFLPANMGLGISYTWSLDEKHSIKTAVDINKLLVPAWPNETGNTSIDSANAAAYRKQTVVNSWFDSFSDGTGLFKSLAYSFGIEYMYDHKFGARVGYYTEDQIRGNRRYYTAGLSAFFKGGGVHLSYLVPTANSNRNILNNTIRLGIIFE